MLQNISIYCGSKKNTEVLTLLTPLSLLPLSKASYLVSHLLKNEVDFNEF